MSGQWGKRVRSVLVSAGRAVDERLFPAGERAADHWLRQVMDRRVDRFLRSLGPEDLTAVEISGDAKAGLGWKRAVSLNYPQFDICDPSPQGQYDVVICEQVLEHVVDPFRAAENLRDLCAPGGHVVVTTPFLVRVHELPMYGMRDYWRFTPRGMDVLLTRAGLEVIEVGTWGNRMSVWANLSRWSARRSWHPMGNNPETPLQVWAFAKRPE